MKHGGYINEKVFISFTCGCFNGRNVSGLYRQKRYGLGIH